MALHFFESEMKVLGLVRIALRCTAIKTDRGLILISPIDFNPAQLRKIHALGPVTDIVSPSLLHHRFIDKTVALFPDAEVWGPPHCREVYRKTAWTKVLAVDPWPYQEQIEIKLVLGVPKFNEVVFFDKATRTLIVTDFVFNMRHPHGIFASLMMKFLGAYKKISTSVIRGRFLKNHAAFEHTVDELMDWNFDRVVMAHGDIIEKNGRAKLREALAN